MASLRGFVLGYLLQLGIAVGECSFPGLELLLSLFEPTGVGSLLLAEGLQLGLCRTTALLGGYCGRQRYVASSCGHTDHLPAPSEARRGSRPPLREPLPHATTLHHQRAPTLPLTDALVVISRC